MVEFASIDVVMNVTLINCVLEHNRFGGGSVMVWAAINHTFKSELVIVNGNLTARQYIDQIFRPVVVPMFRQRPGLAFLQDNARHHVARLTRNFLANNHVNTLPFPAYSPDCNPLKHMWDVLERHLRKRQRQPNTVQELGVALREEWACILRYLLRNLCGSIRRRMDAVVANRGGHTRY